MASRFDLQASAHIPPAGLWAMIERAQVALAEADSALASISSFNATMATVQAAQSALGSAQATLSSVQSTQASPLASLNAFNINLVGNSTGSDIPILGSNLGLFEVSTPGTLSQVST